MKRLFLFAAATAVALSSCSKNEITATVADAQNVIEFSTYSAVATKTTDVDLTALQGTGFKLAGRNEGDDGAAFCAETTVSYVGDPTYAWSFPTLYWPSDGTSVDFIAHNLTSTSSLTEFGNTYSSSDPTITTSETTAEQALDLVVAYADGQTAGNTGGTVALTFKHALSNINLSVTNDGSDSGIKLYIDKVIFKSLDPNGTCTIPALTWSSDGTAADMEKSTTAITALATTDAAASVFTNAMVIPQTAPASVEIYGYFYTGTYGDSPSILDDFSTTARTVNLSSTTWAANTIYNYTFSVTPGSIAINFTVTMGDWNSTVDSPGTTEAIASTDLDGVIAAIVELNGYAATSATRVFTVDATSIATVASVVAMDITSIDDYNFEIGDTITITFGTTDTVDFSTLSITDDSTEIDFEQDSYTSGNVVTFKVIADAATV